MQNLLRFSGSAAAALAFAAFAPTAVAQNTRVFTCQSVGGGSPEPLGDREGHMISVDQSSCSVEGAYAGGVATLTTIWEWDGPKAVAALCHRRRPETGFYLGLARKRGRTHADDDRRQSDRLHGLGTRRQHVGDRRLGQIGWKGLHLDGKVRRTSVTIYGRSQGRIARPTAVALGRYRSPEIAIAGGVTRTSPIIGRGGRATQTCPIALS